MYMLTVISLVWSSEKMAEYFGLLLSMVITARNLLQHNEILTMPPLRHGKTLDLEVQQNIVFFVMSSLPQCLVSVIKLASAKMIYTLYLKIIACCI